MHAQALPVSGIILLLVTLLITASCARDARDSASSQHESVNLAVLHSLPEEPVSYDNQVRPLIERRCVVCHGCYDAPCQLKLSSPEGIERGGSKTKVYNGTRFITAEPTRLFIDARSTDEW